MNKFIGFFSACVMFMALSLNAYASDDLTAKPHSTNVKSSSYTRFNCNAPAFSDDYYNSIYNNGRPENRYQYKPTYTPLNQSPYYNQNIPRSAIKDKDSSRGGSIPPFGTRPTYTPVNNSPYYNQYIPKSAIKDDKNYRSEGVYPWNVKYTYTPANQIKYTPASQIRK